MKTIHRSVSATLTVLLASLVALGGLVAAPPIGASAACDPATRAIQYLSSKQMPDGSIDASLGETADFVLGAAADGIDPNTLKAASGKTPFDYFAADLATATPKTYSDANQLGKVIQGVVAGGRSPSSFSGQDLVSHLLSTGAGAMYNSGTGAFNDGNGGAFQAFAQAQAILGLAAAHGTIPAAAISELKGLQGTSGAGKGGWQVFGSYDSNSTSMALMALAAAGNTPGVDATTYANAYGFLLTQQDPASGGFTYSTDFGTASDPDSDALVIQALTAAGQDPAATAWTNSHGNALADILTFQDPTTGGFRFSHAGSLQAFATSEVPAGLLRAPFPITPHYAGGAAVPAAGCPASATAAVSASPSPAAVPTLPRAGGVAANGTSMGLVALGVLGLLASLVAVGGSFRRRFAGGRSRL